jgi:hypothetical protein
VPVAGNAFHYPSYPGTMPLAGGVPGGVHSQFIPLQVRAGKKLQVSLTLLLFFFFFFGFSRQGFSV